MKGLLTELGMNSFTLVALVISFCAFVAILVWVVTRPQHEMDAQARLYEDHEPAPVRSTTTRSETLDDNARHNGAAPEHQVHNQPELKNNSAAGDSPGEPLR